MIKLSLNIENEHNYSMPSEEVIRQTILNVLKDKNLTGSFEVDIKFVNKNEIHELNKKYRQIDKPTDVLSFPIQNIVTDSVDIPVLLGDIIVCPEMAEETIEKLIEHSTLHLVGIHHDGD